VTMPCSVVSIRCGPARRPGSSLAGGSLKRGRPLFDAIMESRIVRLRPILLTTGAAMLGAAPITIDPIFSGLAWALIFGLFASTVFTLFVIPVVYWLLCANKPGHGLPVVAEEDVTV
jgi:Cu/Ag efflux pump CusA